MKLSISKKIIIIAVAGVVASSLIILLLGSNMTSRLFYSSLENDMRAMQALVANMVDEEEIMLKQTARILITLPQFVDAVYENDIESIAEITRNIKKEFEYDLVTVTDSGGVVLARGHSDRSGDDISKRPMMARALSGETSSGVYYDATAEVPFSIRAFSPIYKDGEFIGVLSIGTNVASDAYVDQIHNITNMNFSIFYGDTRYATSIFDENGNRIAGTRKENAQIVDRVLNRGELVIGRSEILGELNMVALWPVIEGDNNRIIGMWDIAMPISEHVYRMNDVIMIITFISLGIMIVIALIAGWLGNKIARPVRKVTVYATQVAAGNLDIPLDVRSKDEVGLLITAIQTMISTLKDRILETEALNERVLHDVAETKRLMEEVERQRVTAEKANKAKSYFLSTMSHEIRTPMNAVLGITEIQLMNESLSLDTRVDFERIYNAGYLLLGIINDILDLSKIEAGKLELSPANYDVASMLSDTAQLNVLRIGSKLIEFELSVEENTPVTMFGDGLRIKQIFNNLLSNAFKYTDRGTVKMTVSVSDDSCTGDDVIFVASVSDTGRGMTKEQLECIFDDYARFNIVSEQSVEGTGLGMSITNNLINLMNGKISVESEPDKGSIFTIRIPQKRVGTEELGKEMVDNLRMFRASNRALMRRAQVVFEPMPYGNVLIVDDVDSNVYVAKGLMAPYEMNIDSADRGMAAIDKIKNGNVYDVIFMDHMMPEMDGIETTKHIRDMGYTEPIIALTASAVAGQVDMFLNNGFDDYISKPIDIRQMNVIMNKYVRDKQPPEVLETVRRFIENEEKNKDLTKSRINDVISDKIISLMDNKIAGLDITCGLERYYGDIEAYLRVLNSYSLAVRDMLEYIKVVDTEKLADYKIKVHGIKGACYDVFADNLADNAKKLEDAAVSGDLEYISTHNSHLVESATELLDEIDSLIVQINSVKSENNTKPEKDKIDDKLLVQMLAACKEFNMNGVDMIMTQIEDYEYTSDKELSGWLRENVDLINFKKIADRITNEHEQKT